MMQRFSFQNINRRTAIIVLYVAIIAMLLCGTVYCMLDASAISVMSCVLGLAGVVLSISLSLIVAKWTGEDLQKSTHEKLRAIQELSWEQVEANRVESAKLIDALIQSTNSQILQIQESAQAQITTSNQSFQQLISAIEVSTKEQIETLLRSTAKQLEKQEETTNKQLAKIQETTNLHVQEQAKNTALHIEEVRNATQTQIESNRNEFGKLLLTIEATTKRQLESLAASTSQQLQKLDESTQLHLQKMEAVAKAQMDKHDANTREQINEVRNSTKEQIVAGRKEFEQLILSLSDSHAKQLEKMEEEIGAINTSSENQIQNFINQCQTIVHRAEQNNILLCKMLELQLREMLSETTGQFHAAQAQLAELEKWKLFRPNSTKEAQVNQQYDRMHRIQNRMQAIGKELQQINRFRI